MEIWLSATAKSVAVEPNKEMPVEALFARLCISYIVLSFMIALQPFITIAVFCGAPLPLEVIHGPFISLLLIVSPVLTEDGCRSIPKEL